MRAPVFLVRISLLHIGAVHDRNYTSLDLWRHVIPP